MVGLSIQSYSPMRSEYIIPAPPRLPRKEIGWPLNSTMVDFYPFFQAYDSQMAKPIVDSLEAVLLEIKPHLVSEDGAETVVFRGSIVKNMYQRSPVGQALHEQVHMLTRKIGGTDDCRTLPPHIQKALQKLSDPPDIDIVFDMKEPDHFSDLKQMLGFQESSGIYSKQTEFGTTMTWKERHLPSKSGDSVHQTYLGITDNQTGKTQVFDCMTMPVKINFQEEDHRMGLCASYWDMLAAQDIWYVDSFHYLYQPPKQKCVVQYQELSRILNHPDRILHKPNDFTDIIRLYGRISLNNYLWAEGMQDGYSMQQFAQLFSRKQNISAEPHYEGVKNFIRLALLRPTQFVRETHVTGLANHLPAIWRHYSEEKMIEQLKKLSAPDTPLSELVEIISALDPFQK